MKSRQKKPNWLPDWTDITKYPDHEKVTPREWAWEFLRRNAKYQRLWKKLASLQAPSGFIFKGSEAHKTLEIYKRLEEIKERFEKEFGVSNPAPPSMAVADADIDWQPQYWIKPVNWPDHHDFDMTGADLNHPAELLVKLDLRLQIGPQLDSVRTILKSEAKKLGLKEPRGQFQKYPAYLRVLDAKVSGATANAIAEKILGSRMKSTAIRSTRSIKYAMFSTRQSYYVIRATAFWLRLK